MAEIIERGGCDLKILLAPAGAALNRAEKAKSRNSNLILTDQNMPRMDGLTLVTRRVRLGS